VCLWICKECKTVVGSESRLAMPEEIKNGGIGEQLVWLATKAPGNLTCLNEKCINYLSH
jgi:hypothetical protein